MKNIFLQLFYLSLLCWTSSLYANDNVWTEVSLAQRSSEPLSLDLMPERYSLYRLDKAAISMQLNTVARSNTVNTITVPLPNRDIIELVVTETSVMAAELAAKYPQIKTYHVTVVDRPRVQGVIDVTEQGFHAMLLMENGRRLFIDPRQSATGETYYISYYDHDYHPSNKQKSQCQVGSEISKTVLSSSLARATTDIIQPLQRSGINLRTYRLAMVATGEYTRYHGGTVALALSAITTSIARVNQIFERDLAIKLELVANNDQIIFTNANTDPYSDNNDDYKLLYATPSVINNAIGLTSYDIGHVVTSNFGGGLAGLGIVCDETQKGEGMTGLPQPENDPFDIDYLAHELGHQFGANHSFNTEEKCNRNNSTAWEIGNGVTIMGYTGICATSNDVASNSIALFHIGNIREITQFIDSARGGSSCGTSTSLSNQLPSANAGNDYTIPAETPFQLTGSGADADSNTLSYTWEQLDLGQRANISEGDNGDNPLFRAFLPSSANSRTFPQLSSILANSQNSNIQGSNGFFSGEILPTTSRSLNFTFTVRDQKGGIADDDVKLTVIKTSSPFKITSHTVTESLSAGASTNVLWDVAGTSSSPISCSQVDISLSIDGGNSFPTTLTSATNNDGSEVVIVPSSTSTNSSTRLKVACHDNIFFDISDINLSVINTGTSTDSTAASFKENNSNHVNHFKLSLSTALSINASVSFETRDGSAIAGLDYIAKSGTATIEAGKTEQLIGITIIGDSKAEEDETFSLVITNPINGAFPNSVSEVTATHTILNDD